MVYLYISQETQEMLNVDEMIEGSPEEVLMAVLSEQKRLLAEAQEKCYKYQNQIQQLEKAIEALRHEGSSIEAGRTKVSKHKVLNYIYTHPNGVRTIEIVESLYNRVTDEEKELIIKNMSVVLYFLEKDGKIKKERVEGQKGLTYTPTLTML